MAFSLHSRTTSVWGEFLPILVSFRKVYLLFFNYCLSLQPGSWNLYCCSSLHATDPNPGLVQCLLCKTLSAYSQSVSQSFMWPVFQYHHTLSLSERTWDSCCYSVTCTCGPASSVLYSSTTFSWMASPTIFRVRWTIKVMIKVPAWIKGLSHCGTSFLVHSWGADSPSLLFSAFLAIRHCTGGHLSHPSGSVLFCSFPSGLLIPGFVSSCGFISDLVCFL